MKDNSDVSGLDSSQLICMFYVGFINVLTVVGPPFSHPSPSALEAVGTHRNLHRTLFPSEHAEVTSSVILTSAPLLRRGLGSADKHPSEEEHVGGNSLLDGSRGNGGWLINAPSAFPAH